MRVWAWSTDARKHDLNVEGIRIGMSLSGTRRLFGHVFALLVMINGRSRGLASCPYRGFMKRGPWNTCLGRVALSSRII